jgi:hypothetical protein
MIVQGSNPFEDGAIISVDENDFPAVPLFNYLQANTDLNVSSSQAIYDNSIAIIRIQGTLNGQYVLFLTPVHSLSLCYSFSSLFPLILCFHIFL